MEIDHIVHLFVRHLREGFKNILLIEILKNMSRNGEKKRKEEEENWTHSFLDGKVFNALLILQKRFLLDKQKASDKKCFGCYSQCFAEAKPKRTKGGINDVLLCLCI